MHYQATAQIVILLALANGSPVIAKRLCGKSFSLPVDGNLEFFDGRPLFGASKTLRGIFVAIVVTSICAPLVGLDFRIGFVVATTAMAGDLFSSFLKRRIGWPPSSQAMGLDQVPESLFPLLACREALSLTLADVAIGTVIFFAGEVVLSRLLFKFHIRDRPY